MAGASFSARFNSFIQRNGFPVNSFGRQDRAILQVAERNTGSEKILQERLAQAHSLLQTKWPGEFNRLKELQDLGITPDKNAPKGTPEKELAGLQSFIRDESLSGNRIPEGQVDLLGAPDYFALTLHTPSPQPGYEWREDQVLIHSVAEFQSLTQEGIAAMQGNKILPGVANACFGLPVAGVASRALAFAKAHPNLVEKVRQLGALDGLQEGELPPRFLYPIQTNLGIQTLLGIMLENTSRIGRDLGVLIPSILMLNSISSSLVMDRLGRETKHWSEEEKNSTLLFTQPVAHKRYLSDQAVIEGQLFPTGHADFPNLMARYNLYNFLLESGIEYLFFANGDEFCWSVNPTMLAITQRLIQQGYAGICFVVPNTNNQPGGGAVKNLANPDQKFLAENPCMPESLIKGGYPLGLNTTFYALSVRRLAALTINLLTTQPALDVKAVTGRHGGIELAVGVEGWAGCEFTNPYQSPSDFNMAIAFAPRPGFFLGIKSLDHTHSGRIPEEIGTVQKAKLPEEIRGNEKLLALLFEDPAKENLVIKRKLDDLVSIASQEGISRQQLIDALQNAQLVSNPFFGTFTYEEYISYIANRFPQVMQGIMQGDPTTLQRVFEAGGSYLI